LVVSTDRLGEDHEFYWAAMITTAKSGRRRDDVIVTNRERAGLPDDCVIRVSRLATVNEAQIVRRIGEITPKDRSGVLALLRRYVG
jgi:hypothetical protein